MSGSGLGSLMPPHSVWEGLNLRFLCFLMNPTDVFSIIFRYVKEFISSFRNSLLEARSFSCPSTFLSRDVLGSLCTSLLAGLGFKPQSQYY